MALIEAQKLKIVRMFADAGSSLTPLILDEVLAYYVPTAEVETQAGALILEYFPVSGTGAGRKYTKIKGGPEGVDVDPSRQKATIRKELAGLLYLQDYLVGGNRLVRS